MALGTIDISSSTLISNDSNVSITGNNSTNFVDDITKTYLSEFDGYEINRSQFHHIRSTYAGNLSFLVTTAGGFGDTVLRMWKILPPGTDNSTKLEFDRIDITNSTGVSLASGTTKIISDTVLFWRTVNNQVNVILSVEDYPAYSGANPYQNGQTTFYQIPPVASENASAFDVILENGEEYLLEYGQDYSFDTGGSYQINIGSITNIYSAFAIGSVINPVDSFLGYVDIPSIQEGGYERAYIFFNLQSSTLTNSGEKGSILLNRIRKQTPIIPEDATSLTQTSDESSSFTTTEPIRNIPTVFKIDSGGKNFNEGDHIVVCNKNSVHEENNIDLFTTYRDSIFTNFNKAFHSVVFKVTNTTENNSVSPPVEGIITGLELVNPNNIIDINNPTISIQKLDTANFNISSTSYPDSNSPYYVFVFDDKYMDDTSNSSLNTNCEGATITMTTYSTLLFLPPKFNTSEDDLFKNSFLYAPYLKDLYNFFINSEIIGQHYVFHDTSSTYSDLIKYTNNFLKFNSVMTSRNAIPNNLDNTYYRKSTSSHKIHDIHLTENIEDQAIVHKTIPIILSGTQKTTIFDNIPETNFSESNPYIIIDSNRKELDNLSMSELNILPFTKDSYNPFIFDEKYLISGDSIKKFKVSLNNLTVPYKLKGWNATELRYISLHIKNRNSSTRHLYGSNNPTGGLFKCYISNVYDTSSTNKFVQFESRDPHIIQLNIKDDISIQLFDPLGNILEPYENENHALISSNDNIQMSMTIKLTEIKEETNEEHNSIVNNSSTDPIINDSNYDVVNDPSINIPIVNQSEKYVSDSKYKNKYGQFKSNFHYDPKLN